MCWSIWNLLICLAVLNPMTEPWLRGAVPGVPPLLQPVAHALLMSKEDVSQAVAGLTQDQVWLSPGGVTTIGFHVGHLSGATDRLFTYARGDKLSDDQRAWLAAERTFFGAQPAIEELVQRWHDTIEISFGQLRSMKEEALLDVREVGKDRLPSNVLGLLFHAAEHASRHTGQVVTTAKLIKAF